MSELSTATVQNGKRIRNVNHVNHTVSGVWTALVKPFSLFSNVMTLVYSCTICKMYLFDLKNSKYSEKFTIYFAQSLW